MNQDSFVQLVKSPFLSTSIILRLVTNLAVVTPEGPEVILNRFTVEGITHCKDNVRTPNHELLLIELSDTHIGNERHFMILERTANPTAHPSDFIKPRKDSPSVKERLIKSLKETPALFKSLSKSNDSSKPVLHTTSPYQLINNELGPTTTSPTPSSSQLSLLDATSLASTKLVHGSMQSSFRDYKAEDMFIGGDNLDHYAQYLRNIRQIKPKCLSLFELVILADAVHNHEPVYSTLSSQCFWFAKVICDIIEREYICDVKVTGPSHRGLDDSTPPLPNNYLPDLAGRISGILINEPNKEVSSNLAVSFKNYLNEKRKEVSFFVHPECCLLKHRYRYRRNGR